MRRDIPKKPRPRDGEAHQAHQETRLEYSGVQLKARIEIDVFFRVPISDGYLPILHSDASIDLRCRR